MQPSREHVPGMQAKSDERMRINVMLAATEDAATSSTKVKKEEEAKICRAHTRGASDGVRQPETKLLNQDRPAAPGLPESPCTVVLVIVKR